MEKFSFGAEEFLADNPMITIGELLEHADDEVGFCEKLHFSSGIENRGFVLDHQDMLLEEIHDVSKDLLVDSIA